MTKRFLLKVTMLAAAVVTAGCATVDRGETLARIQAAAEEGIVKPAPEDGPPPEVAAALMPEVRVELPGVADDALAQRFDVKVRRARARDFFMSLVEDTPYNVVVHPEVDGRIDLQLKNVTVPEVLDVVRDTYGYDFEHTGNVFRVYPNTIRTRIFKVDYLDMRRSGVSQMVATPGDVSGGTRSNNGASGDTGTSARRTSGSSGSRVTTESVANFWEQLRQDIGGIVGKEEGRQVTVNPLAGLVAVRAMPDELRKVARFLDQTASAVQRQVTLEARIIEVTLSDGYQSGINWAAIGNTHGEMALLGPSGAQSATIDSAGSSLLGAGADMSQVTSSISSSVTESLTLGLFGRDFAAFIDMLRSQGDVQVLSSPRVSTVNNQRAVIKVGADEFFVTDVESDTVTGTATTQNVSVELTPFFSGVSLDVTPQISGEGDVILHIHPTVSEVSEQTKSINTSLGNLVLPLAASTIRESDSIIRARNGQIVVIGGLMQNSLRKEESKVPVLGDIPLLGALFSHTNEVKRKTELVILLRPTIVEGAADWSEVMRGATRGLSDVEHRDYGKAVFGAGGR